LFVLSESSVKGDSLGFLMTTYVMVETRDPKERKKDCIASIPVLSFYDRHDHHDLSAHLGLFIKPYEKSSLYSPPL
jgi:hypothetical protein